MLFGEDLRYCYGLDYEYDSVTNCEYRGCSPDDYCRCGTIENARVTEPVCSWDYTQKEFKKANLITQYCVERILSCLKVWDCSAYTVNTEGDYYGEVIGSITWDASNEADKLIDKLLSLDSNHDRVRFVLNVEYGHILPAIQQSAFIVEDINKSDIIFPNENHYIKLDKGVLKHYEDYPFPRGIVRVGVKNSNPVYYVVDGYHRIAASKDRSVPRNIQVIVAQFSESNKIKGFPVHPIINKYVERG